MVRPTTRWRLATAKGDGILPHIGCHSISNSATRGLRADEGVRPTLLNTEDSRVSVYYVIWSGIRAGCEAIAEVGRGGVEEVLRR